MPGHVAAQVWEAVVEESVNIASAARESRRVHAFADITDDTPEEQIAAVCAMAGYCRTIQPGDYMQTRPIGKSLVQPKCIEYNYKFPNGTRRQDMAPNCRFGPIIELCVEPVKNEYFLAAKVPTTFPSLRDGKLHAKHVWVNLCRGRVQFARLAVQSPQAISAGSDSSRGVTFQHAADVTTYEIPAHASLKPVPKRVKRERSEPSGSGSTGETSPKYAARSDPRPPNDYYRMQEEDAIQSLYAANAMQRVLSDAAQKLTPDRPLAVTKTWAPLPFTWQDAYRNHKNAYISIAASQVLRHR